MSKSASEQNRRAGDTPHRRRLIAYIALIAALLCALCLTLFLMTRSYDSLHTAIQQERMDYAGEISTQLIAGHRFMLEEFSNSTLRFADIVNKIGAQSLDDVASHFLPGDVGSIMLISEAGNIDGLSGKSYFTTDRQIVQQLCRNVGVTQMFSSLNNEEDYWLFATEIQPLNINGQSYCTLVLAIPAYRFNRTLAVSLFGNLGASYIIRKGGSIEVKPDDASVPFGGYNLFSSLVQSGVSQEHMARLRAAIEEGSSGSQLVDIKGQDWLFGYSGIDENNAIVVTIPLTLTAAKTYDGLTYTMVFMSASIILVALIAFAVMLRFFYRDKERSRVAMATQAKSSFFAKMSHDIRTPLNAIIGLQTLIKENTDIQTIQTYNEQAGVASAYLLSIINDVLDMSRIESDGITLAHEPFDMNTLLSEVCTITASMANDKGIVFRSEKNARFEAGYVGDAVRIKQVLMNLLNNAVKFTHSGGTVTLSVSLRAVNPTLDEVTLHVSDTGIGISDEYLTKIFIPFVQEQSSFTQQYAGSGLGLAIVHNLVTQMGGTICVKSELAKGSVFTVVLPIERAAASRHPSPERAAEPERHVSYAGKHVLLAEDNTINQMIASKLLLNHFDIQAETASDGRQAVARFVESAPGYYDLILMDIKMPNMDGLEATKAIRALPRSDAATVPIVALSANAYAEDAMLSKEAGMNDHLSKPIDIGALADTLKMLIDP